MMPLTPTCKFDRGTRAFTLVEMIVSVGVFSMVILAVVYAHLFGLRIDQLTQSKLGASDQTRKSYDQLMLDVRSAKRWSVGNATVLSDDTITNFTPIAEGTPQQGNALQLNLTTDTNICIWYYFDTNNITAGELNGQLRRLHSSATKSTLIAQYIQNTNMLFKMEDYRGGVVRSNQTYKAVITILLQFYQYQYPLTHVGNGFYYDYYQTRFKLTPHVPDGA